jgi:putative sterol carrier protein
MSGGDVKLLPPFTEEWGQVYMNAINSSEGYAEAAESWRWPVALVVEAAPGEGITEPRAILLELEHGTCRLARAVSPDEAAEKADYVMEADIATWKEVMQGRLDPVVATMQGKVRLSKGSLMSLAPYMRAAQELVRCAGRVPTQLP